MSKARQPQEGVEIRSESKGRAFLLMSKRGDAVRVAHSQLGLQLLPTFWPAWLKTLIADTVEARLQVHTRLSANDVIVTAKAASSDGIMKVLPGIARQIRPLNKPLAVEGRRPQNAHSTVQWLAVSPQYVPDLTSLQQHLPEDAVLRLDANQLILEYRGTSPTLLEVAMLVEMQSALDYEQQIQGDDQKLAG